MKSLCQYEKKNILKSVPLSHAAVYPLRLQLQNVQHVLKVFNEKVVAVLKLKDTYETSSFIQ